jgi:hypothetical protein
LFKQPLPVDQPTIFAAKLGLARVADPLLVGSQFPDGHAIDLFPSVATDGEGVLWCAWDASQPRRCIKLARLTQDQSRFEWVGDFGGPGRIASTPELAPVGGNSLLLAWSEKTQGRWQAQVVLLRAGKAVARATIADTGEVLYPQAQGDAAGRYWLVYERTEEQGSEVVLKPLTAELRVQP